jgi:hypothetical protein
MAAAIRMIIDVTKFICQYAWKALLLQLAPAPPFTEPAVLRPRHQRNFHVYEHIRYPRYDELLCAAYAWDWIAYTERLQYAFVGSFAARMNGDDFSVYELEILVDRGTLADDSKKLTDIMDRHFQDLTITSSNRHIIVIGNNAGIGLGIAMRFFEVGTPEYPDEFIPPRESYFRNADHEGQTSTYRGQVLPYEYPHNRCVQVLRFDLLLYQRLLRFDPDSADVDIRLQTQRDLYDIWTFLRCAVRERDPPFSVEAVNKLLPIVKSWIRYSRINGLPTSNQEIRLWWALQIPLTNADIVA